MVNTPSQLAHTKGRMDRALEATAYLGPINPQTALAIQSIRDGFAVKRAQRPAPVITFPEVDRRVGERRTCERRAMADVLMRTAGRREGDPLSMFGGLL